MRVLFVSGLTGFASGGAQTEMIRLVGGMQGRGVEVAFAIDRLPGRLDVRHFSLEYPPGNGVAEQIRTATDAFVPECVHVVGGGLSLLRPMDRMGLGVPWFFTAHNVPPYERISGYFSGYDRLHYLVRNAKALPTVLGWKRFLRRGTFSKVIAHSETVARNLIAGGCPGDKVAMIPLGCEAGNASSSAEKNPFSTDAYPKVLTIAGYAHHKGIHDYISAVGRLIERFPKIEYGIIGNSRNAKYTQFLQNRIEKLKLSHHVKLLRNAEGEVKHAALSAADLYVQPSHEEGFCLAFAEAAMVVPRLIGCRTGEIAGLAADDPTGRVVASKNVDGLVAASCELMGVEVAPAEIAARVQRLLERYSWATYLDRHVELLSRRRNV